MKQILALCFLLCAHFAVAQYPTSFSAGATDITNLLPTKNAWMALPVKTLISQSIAANGSIYDLDSSGCAFFYDLTGRAY